MIATQIKVIAPYKFKGQWVFDDAATGLMRESFVAGADDVIQSIANPIPKSERGFVLLFSHEPFPGHTHSLTRKRKQHGVGTDYVCDQTRQQAWLCPALFNYFAKAPQRLYAQGKPSFSPDSR